jgi:hypothetical protein
MTKVALVLTTINTPKVLELYRARDDAKYLPIQPLYQPKFFVAADERTPNEAYQLCANISDCEIYSPDRQRELGYECSALIPFNSIQRRNIALLEAIKWGADLIVNIDDDNACLGDYFYETRIKLLNPFAGLKASSQTGWFDPGALLVPQTKHRGFPISIKAEPVYEPVTKAKVGVAAGLCLGDPDIDAVTRIATAPTIHSVSQLGETGVVIDPRETKTVFNSQNTSFIRELAPAMFMMPGVGRYDDIYASLICQRVMRERGLHVHFGQPFVWQQRNQHNLINDLRAEIDGMANIEKFGEFLDGVVSSGEKSVVTWLRDFYYVLSHQSFVPQSSTEAALAFLNDIEPIL